MRIWQRLASGACWVTAVFSPLDQVGRGGIGIALGEEGLVVLLEAAHLRQALLQFGPLRHDFAQALLLLAQLVHLLGHGQVGATNHQCTPPR